MILVPLFLSLISRRRRAIESMVSGGMYVGQVMSRTVSTVPNDAKYRKDEASSSLFQRKIQQKLL
jgi:hypothetical protein